MFLYYKSIIKELQIYVILDDEKILSIVSRYSAMVRISRILVHIRLVRIGQVFRRKYSVVVRFG